MRGGEELSPFRLWELALDLLNEWSGVGLGMRKLVLKELVLKGLVLMELVLKDWFRDLELALLSSQNRPDLLSPLVSALEMCYRMEVELSHSYICRTSS